MPTCMRRSGYFVSTKLRKIFKHPTNHLQYCVPFTTPYVPVYLQIGLSTNQLPVNG